ncbi:hypothetical protein EJB05_24028, partial [Eragrostis curvula]
MASSTSSGGRVAGTLALRRGSRPESLIPGLPDDVAAVILCLLTFPDQSRLRATSRAWRLLLSAATLLPLRRSLRLPRRHLLCLFPADPSLASPILLDPAAPTAWWPLPPLPCSAQLYGLANFSALAVGRHLYVLGGSCFDARSYPLGHPSPSAAVYRLDLARSRHAWERLPDMLVPRGGFACAPAPTGGVIVAGGGSRHPTFPSNGSRTSSTEWYDAATRSWHVAAAMPRERAECVGFVAHGTGDGGEDEFWVMGGYDGYTTVGGVVPNDVYCRDAVALGLWSGKWREIGGMWEEGERHRLGPVAALSADDGRITEVFMLDGHDVFRYDFTSNRWLKEATARRRIPNTGSCGFISVNGELYVLTTSTKVSVAVSGSWRQLKKKVALEFQVYNPGTKEWRVLTTHPPVHELIDFKSAALCTVEL